ncbi:MAG: methyltransferase domain-containing protein [Myxococcota bacterium]
MGNRRRPTPRPHLAWTTAALLCCVVALGGGCTFVKRMAYEGFGREAWQQPERVVADLALAPGAKVADLGSGGGYFTFRLARAVGPSGHVYAVDVDEGMNEYVTGEAADQGFAHVTAVLAAADDAALPEPVDLVFTSNAYHHLTGRVAYFRQLRETHLAAGGRVAIVEFRPEVTSHATARETIEEEMAAAGYRLDKAHDYLERQHFLIFAAEAVDPEQPVR